MPEPKWIGCAPNNFRQGRPAHVEVEAVVIHIIDGSQQSADATFLDNHLNDRRSAHYSIGRDGTIHQYVHEQDTAFHAGVVVNPSWAQIKKNGTSYVNPNFYTIGIEHDGKADSEWTPAMYEASAGLLRSMSARYPKLRTLTRDNVVLHREIRSNKSCPGNQLDIVRLIALASGAPSDGVDAPALPDIVATTSSVNLRIGSPSTAAAIARVLPPDSLVHVVRAVTGEKIIDRNNRAVDKWYETLDGTFLWSGVTEQLQTEQA